MTKTDDPLTVEISGDGFSTGPIPMDEFEARVNQQLSFDLGTGRRDSPDFATLKIPGQIRVQRDLHYQEGVTITITDAHGEVIASAAATLGYPVFKDHFDKHDTKTVERVHSATLD